ncbi:MAG: hypothetical protein Fur0012_01220 [Elusimicrobiota bacterium]
MGTTNRTFQKTLTILYYYYLISHTIDPSRTWYLLSKLENDLRKIDHKDFNTSLYYLKKKKYLKELKDSKGMNTYLPSDKGAFKLASHNLFKGKKLTGEKLIVFFDIPEKQRKKRNYFRKCLIKTGFKEIQKSVFINDYDMREELEILISFLQVEPFVEKGLFKKI